MDTINEITTRTSFRDCGVVLNRELKSSFLFLFVLFIACFSTPSFSKPEHTMLGNNNGKVSILYGKYEIISDIEVSDLQIRRVRNVDNTNINRVYGCFMDHIEVSGPINPDTPYIIERLIKRINEDNRCTTGSIDARTLEPKTYAIDVYLNSGGGYIKDGYKLGEIFRKNSITTNLAWAAECYSSCAAAYLGGSNRRMYGNAKLMFHAPYRYKNEYFGIGRPDIACSAEDNELRKYMIKMLTSKDGNFLYERTMSYCSVSDGWSLNKDAAEIFNIINLIQ